MIRHAPAICGPHLRRGSGWLRLPAMLLGLLIAFGAHAVHACVGSGCLQIWSTADGGGMLTLQWDFTKEVQTGPPFCFGSSCIYSTTDPGFMAPSEAVPDSGYYRLADGTTVSVVILDTAPGVSMNINGKKLYQPGDTALLGTMPTIHVHPSWQVVVPEGQFRGFPISFQLKSDSPAYADSVPLALTVTNIQPTPDASPTATPTPPPTGCAGDCDANATVTVNELVVCVSMALDISDTCHACDANGDGAVSIDEIIAAVDAALSGCPAPPTVTLTEIQQTIFTPRCATFACHSGASPTGGLSLVEGVSHAQLVNVPPSTLQAAQAGLFRVDPGHPDNSFLLVKLMGQPPVGEGGPMPVTGDPLMADEIKMIRDWILEGAQP